MSYIIYWITCNNTNIKDSYVGHTTDYENRYSRHKNSCNDVTNTIRLYETIRQNDGWENWNMTILEKMNEETTFEEAREREEHYRIGLQATLNTNRCYVDETEKKINNIENVKLWRKNNTEEYNDYQRNHYKKRMEDEETRKKFNERCRINSKRLRDKKNNGETKSRGRPRKVFVKIEPNVVSL